MLDAMATEHAVAALGRVDRIQRRRNCSRLNCMNRDLAAPAMSLEHTGREFVFTGLKFLTRLVEHDLDWSSGDSRGDRAVSLPERVVTGRHRDARPEEPGADGGAETLSATSVVAVTEVLNRRHSSG